MHQCSWALSSLLSSHIHTGRTASHTPFSYFQVFLRNLNQLKFSFKGLSYPAGRLIFIGIIQTDIAKRFTHFWVGHKSRCSWNADTLSNWIHLFWLLFNCLESLPATLIHCKGQLRFISRHLLSWTLHEFDVLPSNSISIGRFTTSIISCCRWGIFTF